MINMECNIIAFGYNADDELIAAQFDNDTADGDITAVSYWITQDDLAEASLCN